MSLTLFWMLFALQVLLFLTGMGFVFFIAYVLWSFRKQTPYVPTPRKVVRAMLRHANITPQDHVVDLGCGDGRLLRAVAKRYPVEATGVDDSHVLLRIARILNALTRKQGTIRLVRAKWDTYPLTDATLAIR